MNAVIKILILWSVVLIIIIMYTVDGKNEIFLNACIIPHRINLYPATYYYNRVICKSANKLG